MPATQPLAPRSDLQRHPLEHVVISALEENPYLDGGRVRIEAAEGQVRLHGSVGSYYEKQMAQEAVRRLDGVERVENLLQVSWV